MCSVAVVGTLCRSRRIPDRLVYAGAVRDTRGLRHDRRRVAGYRRENFPSPPPAARSARRGCSGSAGRTVSAARGDQRNLLLLDHRELSGHLFRSGFSAESFFRHRGAFHSIPAAILAGEGAFLVFAGSTLQARFAFALAVAGGYLSHLLLDELWSVNLFGIAEKKSAGSAFTWKTDSPSGTVLLYLAVALLGGFCVF